MKAQNYINREAAKTSTLVSGKIHKFEYLTSEEICSSDQNRIIERATFTYSLLEKSLEKQTKQLMGK